MSVTTIQALADQLSHLKLTEPSRQPRTTRDFDALVELGIVTPQGQIHGRVISPEKFTPVPATAQTSKNFRKLYDGQRIVGGRETSLRWLVSQAKSHFNVHMPSITFVDEELYKLLGDDWLLHNYLQLVGDPQANLHTYLSPEVVCRLRKECTEE